MEFRTAREPSLDGSIEVCLGGVVVGHIRCDPTSGTFRYSRLPRAWPAPFYEDPDLGELVRRVAERP